MVVRGLDCIEEAGDDAEEELTSFAITRIVGYL